MKRVLISMLLAGVAGLHMPAVAEGEGGAPAYDVLGVVMGLTPAEVDAHFNELGWELVDEKAFVIGETGTEFIASRTYAVTDLTQNQDRMEVEFARPPVAPRAIRLFRTYKPYPADYMIQPKLLPLDQMEASVIGKYGDPQFTDSATAARMYRWSSDVDSVRCASYHKGNFTIVPSSGRAPVPDCHGQHLAVNLQFRMQNIGPTLSQATFDLVDVDEYRVDFTRFRSHLADIQTRKEQEQTRGAEAPPL